MKLSELTSAVDSEALQVPRYFFGVCSAMMLFAVIGSQWQRLQCINSEILLCRGQTTLHISSSVRVKQGKEECSASGRYALPLRGWRISSYSHCINVDFLVLAIIHLQTQTMWFPFSNGPIPRLAAYIRCRISFMVYAWSELGWLPWTSSEVIWSQ